MCENSKKNIFFGVVGGGGRVGVRMDVNELFVKIQNGGWGCWVGGLGVGGWVGGVGWGGGSGWMRTKNCENSKKNHLGGGVSGRGVGSGGGRGSG